MKAHSRKIKASKCYTLEIIMIDNGTETINRQQLKDFEHAKISAEIYIMRCLDALVKQFGLHDKNERHKQFKKDSDWIVNYENWFRYNPHDTYCDDMNLFFLKRDTIPLERLFQLIEPEVFGMSLKYKIYADKR